MIEVATLISVCGVVLSAFTFFIGRTTAAKSSGAADGEMKADIKHIKVSVEKQDAKMDGIIENYDDLKLEIERLKGRLKSLEQKVDMLHGSDGGAR